MLVPLLLGKSHGLARRGIDTQSTFICGGTTTHLSFNGDGLILFLRHGNDSNGTLAVGLAKIVVVLKNGSIDANVTHDNAVQFIFTCLPRHLWQVLIGGKLKKGSDAWGHYKESQETNGKALDKLHSCMAKPTSESEFRVFVSVGAIQQYGYRINQVL